MHDIISFLKDAVARGPGMGVYACYVVRNGMIYAQNASLAAGLPWPEGPDFTISADALDSALSRMKNVKSLVVEDDNVILKDGRLKLTIKRVHTEPPPPPEVPEEWDRSPPGLARVLAIAKNFIGDRSWQLGVRLAQGRVTAFSGYAGIDLDIENLNIERPFLLSPETCAYIAAQGDPDEMSPEKNAVNFRYEDGRWLRARFIDNDMPEDVIQKILNKAGDKAPVIVDAQWREALADAAALSDGTVLLTANGLTGTKENITSEVEFAIDVGEKHASHWNSQKAAGRAPPLQEIMEIVDRWNPANYPDPALFLGDGIRGVIVGYRK